MPLEPETLRPRACASVGSVNFKHCRTTTADYIDSCQALLRALHAYIGIQPANNWFQRRHWLRTSTCVI